MRKDVYEKVQMIKAMEKDLKINKSALSKQLNCDPRTVSNYLSGKTKGERKKVNRKSLLDDYKSLIKEKVDNYSATALSIYKFIEKKGYKGKYGLVRNYVRTHKGEQTKKATIRFETNPGLQAQVDFKERKKLINKKGKVFEIYIFLYILGYSRVKYLEVSTDKSQKTVFNGLMNSFKETGGIPDEILFDNMATVVDRHNSYLGEVTYNKKFMQFSKDFGFKPIACRPYRAQTKGKVEALAKLTNRLDVYNNEFETFEDIVKIVNQLNKELNNEISQAINTTPNKRLEIEKEYLNDLPNLDLFQSYKEKHREYKVSKESMITYLGNKYSVPTAMIGKRVELQIENGTMKIFANNDLIASHKISNVHLNYQKDHVKEILRSDAFKNSSDEELEQKIENMKHMDLLLT